MVLLSRADPLSLTILCSEMTLLVVPRICESSPGRVFTYSLVTGRSDGPLTLQSLANVAPSF